MNIGKSKKNMHRDWRISNTLDQIDESFHLGDYTLEQALDLAKLQGLRDDEMWKIEHLWEVLNEFGWSAADCYSGVDEL